jgi:D-tyrosyl-tRNA(Tyr) deacylase
MKTLIQRVRSARVEVAGEVVGAIDQGLLALVGIEPQDTPASVEKALHKLLNYRVFSDAAGKMNLSLSDVAGGLLLVSQFTLAADTKSGLRPSFTSAAPPALGAELFDLLVAHARARRPSGRHWPVRCRYAGASDQ